MIDRRSSLVQSINGAKSLNVPQYSDYHNSKDIKNETGARFMLFKSSTLFSVLPQ
jgi:hypothetical protein